ncbi:MAG: histidinol dehydrogenase [Verrucomicrobiae bacterium]|nr:histidinol dehydrogenase [Verrucomicrobiae bacterium]
MKFLRFDQPDFEAALASALVASSILDPQIEQRVRAILDEVRQRGDDALRELTERFDKVQLTEFHVRTRPRRPPRALAQALDTAHRNITAFAKRSLRRNWQMRNAQGAQVGEKFDPIHRVGIYVPGGTAPLISTALMTITLAKVAGCQDIVACSPPPIHPHLHYAAHKAGATEILQLGGAQAIAAMAFGTKSIQAVAKIFGPGNAYVTAAKRLLFGVVGIDMISGPSELLVLADDTAPARWVAADLLAQAEHGSGYERVWLVTTSEKLLRETEQEWNRQLMTTPRRSFIEKVEPVAVLARDLAQAIEITNQFAPEHCEVITRQPQRVAKRITTAGALFIGPWSPTVVGDYLAGPSHALPTNGAGAWCAGLTVDQFQRRTSIIQLDRRALQRSLPALEEIGCAEQLTAHVQSAQLRFA